MRAGNFSFKLLVAERPWLVHRGVSQGGRKLSAQKRYKFWVLNSILHPPKPEMLKIEQVSTKGRPMWRIITTAECLSWMQKKALVLVEGPTAPRVWTPKRIRQKAVKIYDFDGKKIPETQKSS